MAVALAVCKSEQTALDKQRAAKKLKQGLLCQKKMVAVQKEYANALTYIDMFHSAACWQNKRLQINLLKS